MPKPSVTIGARAFLAVRLFGQRERLAWTPIQAFGLPLYDVPEKQKPQEGGS